jgi:hypothetical protein
MDRKASDVGCVTVTRPRYHGQIMVKPQQRKKSWSGFSVMHAVAQAASEWEVSSYHGHDSDPEFALGRRATVTVLTVTCHDAGRAAAAQCDRQRPGSLRLGGRRQGRSRVLGQAKCSSVSAGSRLVLTSSLQLCQPE